MRTSDKVYAVVGAYNAIVKNILARDKAQREALIAEIENKLNAVQKASLPDSSYRKGFDEVRNALHQLKDPERS